VSIPGKVTEFWRARHAAAATAPTPSADHA